MPIILPGMSLARPRICEFCDEDLLYLAVYTIKAFDARQPERFRALNMEFPVCDLHADKVSFEIIKQIVVPKNLIVL